MGSVTAKAYESPSCILLAFDWPDGTAHPDFLGFAIQRAPGYTKTGEPQYLFNKLDFSPIEPGAEPKGSDVAPIQKFNWWDGGLKTEDQGKTFEYTITPVLGTGPNDLELQAAAATALKVTVPKPRQGDIEIYFNRAVVSAQSFLTIKGGLGAQMDWLANGLEQAIPQVLGACTEFDCAIYHLSDKRWILPAFEKFEGNGSLIYFSKGDDTKSDAAIELLAENKSITPYKRDAIPKLMHDKFIVARKEGETDAVLMGSTNFTPEAQTVQANLLHVFHSNDLAKLYLERAALLAANKGKREITAGAGWKPVDDVGGTKVRVFFLPEAGSSRVFLDTVTESVKAAKSSVLFCMFTASDEALMNAIFEKADSADHIAYGVLNSIDDPEKPTKSGQPRRLPKIAATIFHRSSEKPDTLPYSAFGQNAPRGFLPELRTINCDEFDASKTPGERKTSVPPIHIHHKFIVIDGDTDRPIIYTGSPNFSAASESSNDENVLELRDNVALARIYVAEFIRLYNHYRARAIWNKNHETQSKEPPAEADPLVLKTKRDDWAKEAYTAGTKQFLARTRGL
ncbi:phospholipase D-like domain-containing protein [Rhizobium miluonense]|uniref:Phospholipase D n=1 Tax=Rhizobium miluonense TaxID=411945 RepID=A0A1C3X829_9HYPH|nr:phospholipase D-like domain-containing protein [Rhizobium miluonense]SCB48144.1 PLD-like domain-containing protein [Rhizobium miluonense]